MKNYDRYLNTTGEQYEKKTIMSYFCRLPADRKLIPLIRRIKGKKILDVGLGSGCYTKILLENNEVIGVDRNPHLCRVKVEVLKGDATELSRLVQGRSFDIVFSTWMTEYLNPEQLSGFFAEARKALPGNGRLITTVISKCGWGFIYITMAKLLRGINKYNYKKSDVADTLKAAGFTKIEFVPLDSWLKIPWAYIVIAE